jgi:hypothetical protein
MTHHLAQAWASAAGEQDYMRAVEAMVQGGQLDEAAAMLLGDLAMIDSPLAAICRALTPDSLSISGWDDIATSVAQFEGDPITAVHLVMSNPTDLVFEAKSAKTDEYEPMVEVAFYTDAHLAFSALAPAQLLAESLAPAADWYGQSEDIEVYVEIAGLAGLNTALLRHSTQFFLRPDDGAQAAEAAPLAYVEFTLAALFRAVRFHQAVKAALDAQGLPGNVPVIIGMDNMRATIGSVYYPQVVQTVATPEIAPLSIAIKPRVEQVVMGDPSGTSLRRRFMVESNDEPEAASAGFFKRLFARA